MHPFEMLAEPIRRRIVEVLASGEHTAGTLETLIRLEYGVSRSAVQHHLAVLRREGWVDVRPELTERFYGLEPDTVEKLEREVGAIRHIWDRRTGWSTRRDPPMSNRRKPAEPLLSRRGRRGLGVDPDDPWLHGTMGA
jgi:DNA-binding transcriptional ArsR family regulator